MMIIIRSILLSKNPSACFHMLGKNVLKDWNATFASYCCCFPQTTQEKPLLKLKISKSHLLCCGKLGGLHCLLLLTDILFRSVSAPLWSFVTRFNKFSHWEMATKNWVKHSKFNHWRKKENGPNWETNNRLQRGAVKMTQLLPSWFKSHLEIRNIYIYFINTNEITGELSRENMISSHGIFTCEKITVAIGPHNKLRLSQPNDIYMKWYGISLVFIW